MCSTANKAVMDCLCLLTPNSYTEMTVLERRGLWGGDEVLGVPLMNGDSAHIETPGSCIV